MVTGQRARLAIALTALLCALPSSAQAFDTGPHADMTRDALTSEGFGLPSANIVAVNNWFVDYYSNPGKNPYSGHGGFWIGLTRLGLRPPENWPQNDVAGARKLHFDAEQGSTIYLGRTAGVEREWDRLIHMTQRLLRLAGQRNDPLMVLSTMGMSLHAVQDFYTHSNWVEDLRPDAPLGLGGPGVASLRYGDHPTFFDIPPDVRQRELVGEREVYTVTDDVDPSPNRVKKLRGHGHWRSHLLPPFPGRTSRFEEALNKDSPGRPKFQEAYITAYFATRQWVRAMRTWLGNEPLWNRAMSMPHTSALAHDVEGATEISRHLGHWQGGGQPCVRFISCGPVTGKAGSVTSATIAVNEYHLRGRTPYRRAFAQIIGEGRLYYPEDRPSSPRCCFDLPDHPDLPSSRAIQALTRFVKLEVINYRGFGLGDPVGDADIYANARINGQPYTSTVINDAQSFSFREPYAPFTWLRSVPTANQASTPVTSMIARIETGNRKNAGTDDDVYLRVNGSLRFNLDKARYDDFERGDNDTYSVPIGAATKNGLTVGDIDRVWVEKSKDGSSGGWFLHGVTLLVNGQEVVADRAIDRWLEKSNRTWIAPNFVRDDRTDDVVGAWLELKDDDYGPQDTGDINEYDRHTSFPIAYRPGAPWEQAIRGGARYMGRLPMDNGDSARLTYRFTTFATTPPSPPPPPPPLPPEPPPPPPVSGQAPDLVISNLTGSHFTVRNEGNADAGPFRVTVRASGTEDTHFEFTGLARGQEETREYFKPCEQTHRAVADSANQVPERDESNNTREFSFPFC
jgi:hypothetical protein